MAEAATLALLAVAISKGFGRHNYYINGDAAVAIKLYSFVLVLTGAGASWFARISIACLLLELTISRLWRTIILATLVTQAAAFLAFEITHLARCRPVMAMWTTVEGSQCLSPAQAWAYAYSSIGELTFLQGNCRLVILSCPRRCCHAERLDFRRRAYVHGLDIAPPRC